MYKVHDITEYNDLECALAAARIIKIDSGNRHTVVVETPDSSLIYVAERDLLGHVKICEYEAE